MQHVRCLISIFRLWESHQPDMTQCDSLPENLCYAAGCQINSNAREYIFSIKKIYVFFLMLFLDCRNPTDSTGYTVTAGQGATATLEGATATVACADGYTEDAGTPAPLTCQASGAWTTPSGCSSSNAGSTGKLRTNLA